MSKKRAYPKTHVDVELACSGDRRSLLFRSCAIEETAKEGKHKGPELIQELPHNEYIHRTLVGRQIFDQLLEEVILCR